jgi:TRAP-type uncharacterized transport system fused permease subunit
VLAVAYGLVKAALAIGLWGMASIGCLYASLIWWERLLAFIAGGALILALPVTDEIGFALAGLTIGVHLWRTRTVKAGVT